MFYEKASYEAEMDYYFVCVWQIWFVAKSSRNLYVAFISECVKHFLIRWKEMLYQTRPWMLSYNWMFHQKKEHFRLWLKLAFPYRECCAAEITKTRMVGVGNRYGWIVLYSGLFFPSEANLIKEVSLLFLILMTCC